MGEGAWPWKALEQSGRQGGVRGGQDEEQPLLEELEERHPGRQTAHAAKEGASVLCGFLAFPSQASQMADRGDRHSFLTHLEAPSGCDTPLPQLWILALSRCV